MNLLMHWLNMRLWHHMHWRHWRVMSHELMGMRLLSWMRMTGTGRMLNHLRRPTRMSRHHLMLTMTLESLLHLSLMQISTRIARIATEFAQSLTIESMQAVIHALVVGPGVFVLATLL